MTTINTNLVKDGNSMAVRLPKQVLAISGLNGAVQLEVKKGQIILRPTGNPRAGWQQQIEEDIVINGALNTDDEYGNLLEEADATISDGLGN